MKCRSCNIEVNCLSSNCPLCGSHLTEGLLDMEPAYPELLKLKHRVHDKPVRILLFITIVLSLSAFAVNMLTPHKSIWSVIAIYSMWLCWLLIALPIINRKISLPVIVFDYISVSVFLYMLDMTFGRKGWSLDYAIPFVLCGSSLITTVTLISAGVNWRDFYLYEAFMAVICFVPLIMIRFMGFLLWPSIVSAGYGITTILGLIILGSRGVKREAQKRLHF